MAKTPENALPLGFAALVTLGMLACAPTASGNLPTLRSRAAFDLSCPEDQLQLTALATDDATQGVSGCGRRATYIWTIPDHVWVMNSDNGARAPGAPSAPTPAPPAPLPEPAAPEPEPTPAPVTTPPPPATS